jgi:hypothetical protein
MASAVRSSSRCCFPNRKATTRTVRARGSGDRVSVYGTEESPGSTEQRCRVTPGWGDPRESATENRPPFCFGEARSKRGGKSAPRAWQQERHGKPHREQDRIGTAHGPARLRRPGWLLDPGRKSGTRGMVAQPRITVRGGQNPAYRPSGALLQTVTAHYLVRQNDPD